MQNQASLTYIKNIFELIKCEFAGIEVIPARFINRHAYETVSQQLMVYSILSSGSPPPQLTLYLSNKGNQLL